jgi:Cytochrome P460
VPLRPVVLLVFVASALYGSGRRHAAPAPDVPYPDGYRRWAHVKSGIVGKAGDSAAGAGWHHVYANEPARRGLERGRYADGAVLVFDRLLAERSADGTVEGRRLSVDVMVRDSARYAAIGGWGFERFRGDTRDRVVRDPGRQCAQCHAATSPGTLVISRPRR